MSANKSSIEARFWSKVAVIHDADSCWLWRGTITGNGYGAFKVKGEMLAAHRYAYAITYGDIPSGILCCHRCDTPLCARPIHLFLGTPGDNMRDASAKGRMANGERHHARAHAERLYRGDDHWTHTNVERVCKGEGHQWTILRAADVLEIRSLWSAPARPTQMALAKQYGVSKGAITSILQRRSWKHI